MGKINSEFKCKSRHSGKETGKERKTREMLQCNN